MPKTYEAYLPQTLKWMSPRRTPISASNLSSSWCNWRTARLPATKFFIRTNSPRPLLNPTLRVVSRSVDKKVTFILHSFHAAVQQINMQISHGIFRALSFAMNTEIYGNYSNIMTRSRHFQNLSSSRKSLNKVLIIAKLCKLSMSNLR